MSYDVNKLVKLGALKSLSERIKSDYATKDELAAIKVPEYSITKQGTAESGYLATYQLTKGGSPVGEKINIPKDFLVNSADILEVEEADQPYDGAEVGDLYIDFVVNSKNADDTATHIYLPVNELVDVYTGGNGIEVSPQSVISAKVDLASASTAGAMSAADKTKLDSVAEGATKVEASSTPGAIKVNGSEVTVVQIAGNEEVTEMLNEVFAASTDDEG